MPTIACPPLPTPMTLHRACNTAASLGGGPRRATSGVSAPKTPSEMNSNLHAKRARSSRHVDIARQEARTRLQIIMLVEQIVRPQRDVEVRIDLPHDGRIRNEVGIAADAIVDHPEYLAGIPSGEVEIELAVLGGLQRVRSRHKRTRIRCLNEIVVGDITIGHRIWSAGVKVCNLRVWKRRVFL